MVLFVILLKTLEKLPISLGEIRDFTKSVLLLFSNTETFVELFVRSMITFELD